MVRARQWMVTNELGGRSAAMIAILVIAIVVFFLIGMPIALIEERLRDDLTSNLRSVEQEAIRRSKIAN